MKEWNEITVMLNMTKEEAVSQLSRMGCTHEVTYQINDSMPRGRVPMAVR